MLQYNELSLLGSNLLKHIIIHLFQDCGQIFLSSCNPACFPCKQGWASFRSSSCIKSDPVYQFF